MSSRVDDADPGVTGEPAPARPAGAAPPAGPVERRERRLRRARRVPEAAAVALGSLAAAALAHLPMLRGLSSSVPGDVGDPLLIAWQLAWVAHALPLHAGDVYTTNAFLGAPDTLAYSDVVLGYLPLNWLRGGEAGALQALNLATLLATAMALAGGYALARALGSGPAGAVVAGAGFGFAPWRLQQITHVNVLSTGGMALALACLCLGRGWSLREGWRPDRMRTGWVVAGWAIACWQLTVGLAVGIPFGYAVLGVTALGALGLALPGRWRATAGRRGALAADAAGATAFALVALALSRPYFRVVETVPAARRSADLAKLFSPPWQGWFIAPETSTFWGERQRALRSTLVWPPEMVLSPGVLLMLLAALGLVVSVWPLRRRLLLAAATVGTAVLALAATGPAWGLYLVLYDHAPGWNALRTPGRLVVWVTLGVALLAAGAVARVAQAVRSALQPRGRRAGLAGAALAAAVPALLVAYEGLGDVPQWPIAPGPVDTRTVATPVLYLPSDPIGDYTAMFWSTQGWPVIANGSSGFDPPYQAELRDQVKGFPDAAAVAALRGRGVRTVVLSRTRAAGTPWEGAADRNVSGLGVTRHDLGDAVVFDLPR